MKNFISIYKKIEYFFGNLKFAVVIISIFAVYLGYGTFMESYHGTEYANRLVYKSLPFMLVQFGMLLSIFFATLIRLPPKKHLYGFYCIHAGLIILFLGSFITYVAGIDGSITLAPNSPSRDIELSEYQLSIEFPSRGKEVSVDLPFSAHETELNFDYEEIRLLKFLPFSEDQLNWIPHKIKDTTQSSARYELFNENFGETLTLSLHPLSDFQNTLKLGPLNVHYMPESLYECFTKNTQEGLIVWNGENQNCLAPDQNEIKKRTVQNRSLVEVFFEGNFLRFTPSMSPLPLNEAAELNPNSSYRIFSKKLFEKSPHLFLFGKKGSFYNKDTKNWVGIDIFKEKATPLPWMGFQIQLLNFETDSYATLTPSYVKPIQDGGQVIKGLQKAALIKINDQTFWVKSNDPVAFNQNGERIIFNLKKKSIRLPFELNLDKFKMDTDPGTNNPASYESFVSLFKGDEGTTKHHIFMNNPLKFNQFTFYQASYFQTQDGPFGSVLSVNFDPGRAWKYFGCLILVLGSMWHYYLRRKHILKPGVSHE